MTTMLHRMLIMAGAGAFCLALTNMPADAANTLIIVVDRGPHAGTYTLPAANTICLKVAARRQFSAAYKDIKARDAKAVSGAGINVFNPDDAGPKRGEINIRFGDPDEKRPAAYEVSIARDSTESLTLTKKGNIVALAFDGHTKDGIRLKVTATCMDVDEF